MDEPFFHLFISDGWTAWTTKSLSDSAILDPGSRHIMLRVFDCPLLFAEKQTHYFFYSICSKITQTICMCFVDKSHLRRSMFISNGVGFYFISGYFLDMLLICLKKSRTLWGLVFVHVFGRQPQALLMRHQHRFQGAMEAAKFHWSCCRTHGGKIHFLHYRSCLYVYFLQFNVYIFSNCFLGAVSYMNPEFRTKTLGTVDTFCFQAELRHVQIQLRQLQRSFELRDDPHRDEEWSPKRWAGVSFDGQIWAVEVEKILKVDGFAV